MAQHHLEAENAVAPATQQFPSFSGQIFDAGIAYMIAERSAKALLQELGKRASRQEVQST